MRDEILTSPRHEPLRPPLPQRGPGRHVATAAEEVEVRTYFAARQASLNVVKSTTTRSGQVIDWIERSSQGPIAEPPPRFALPKADAKRPTAMSRFELEIETPHASEGLVPVLRRDPAGMPAGRTLRQILSKGGSPLLRDTRGIAPLPPEIGSPHDYAFTSQSVTAYGCETYISANEPFVWYHDEFSLAQLGLSHGTPAGLQTVEVGWQSYKDLYQDLQPHLFVFYTTNGYSKSGNNLGGYNRDVNGWVQYSSTIFPGTVSSPRSVVGGAQFEMHLKVQLWQGNYWVAVNGNWIGYYPASLFRTDGLASSANNVAFFGEIVDSSEHVGATATWMGSGYWAEAGWEFAAYQRSLAYQSDASGTMQPYNPGSVWVTDTKEYTVDVHANSGSNWGSYFWFGGPGTGAPLGANPPPVG